ncbi:MAG: DoxX-like family protein [Daejeonella sp.]|uniref:MauE/DoxX family redox-associated membrane protein n=1 Tax=Daejeonella sp. TaxID=2805397 RepID=UPI0027330D4C|nr:MauE/DoxX family redox-associated membrane protein [Daejeonella sp.]MDP3467558.1 DoxX-like family protein [Daejeonella sp.]
MNSHGTGSYDDILNRIVIALLILLWIYSGVSKLIESEETQQQILNQIVPKVLSRAILWGISIIEILTALLLSFRTTRPTGIIISVALMGVFCLYIGAVVLGLFRYTPCSCGGIIANLSWTQHLIFNACFLAIALYAFFIDLKERRSGKNN